MSARSGVTHPAGWKWQPLGRVMRRSRLAGKPEWQPLSVFLDDGVVPRSDRDDNHNQLGADLSNYLVVEPGDLVFNKLRTWQGGFGHSRFSGIVSPAYYVLRPTPALDTRFMDYLLHSSPYLAELTRLSKWMPPSQFDMPWDELKTLPVPLPPLDVQRRIADFLDDRVGLVVKGDDKIHMDRCRKLELKWAPESPPEWTIHIGDDRIYQDPAQRALGRIERLIAGLHDAGVWSALAVIGGLMMLGAFFSTPDDQVHTSASGLTIAQNVSALDVGGTPGSP